MFLEPSPALDARTVAYCMYESLQLRRLRVHSCRVHESHPDSRRQAGLRFLQLAELPIPEPGPGQVLIRVEAVGVNFIEIYFRKGVYKATLPLTPGSEAAGTVEELGPGVTGFEAGDAVASVSVLGSYAEYALVPAAQLVKVPSRRDVRSRPPRRCCRA